MPLYQDKEFNNNVYLQEFNLPLPPNHHSLHYQGQSLEFNNFPQLQNENKSNSIGFKNNFQIKTKCFTLLQLV